MKILVTIILVFYILMSQHLLNWAWRKAWNDFMYRDERGNGIALVSLASVFVISSVAFVIYQIILVNR